MRAFLALAAATILTAGLAQAQIKPIPPVMPVPGIPPVPGVPAYGAKAPPAFKPYEPPKLPSAYDDGPFSPRGEAKRERARNAAPVPGPFSPEGEAKRRKDDAQHYHPF